MNSFGLSTIVGRREGEEEKKEERKQLLFIINCYKFDKFTFLSEEIKKKWAKWQILHIHTQFINQLHNSSNRELEFLNGFVTTIFPRHPEIAKLMS